MRCLSAAGDDSKRVRNHPELATTLDNYVQAFLPGLCRSGNLLCGKSIRRDACSLAQLSLRRKPSMYFLGEHVWCPGPSVAPYSASHGRNSSFEASLRKKKQAVNTACPNPHCERDLLFRLLFWPRFADSCRRGVPRTWNDEGDL